MWCGNVKLSAYSHSDWHKTSKYVFLLLCLLEGLWIIPCCNICQVRCVYKFLSWRRNLHQANQRVRHKTSCCLIQIYYYCQWTRCNWLIMTIWTHCNVMPDILCFTTAIMSTWRKNSNYIGIMIHLLVADFHARSESDSDIGSNIKCYGWTWI